MSDQVTQADTGVQPLEGERYRTLANGARQDLVTGKIVAGAVIDRDRGREMVRAREEKRIRLYTEGAGRAVQDTQLIREYGKDAHIVERGMTLQQIATTPDAGKAAVMAAQALDVAQGLIVKGKPETADGGVTFDDAQRDLIRDLAAIARRVSAEIDAAIDSEAALVDDAQQAQADNGYS